LFNKYAILLLYFFDKNKKNNLIITKIIREVYLINNLKTNILIESSLINFEEITINVASKSIFINSCDVIVLIKVKTSRIIIYILIYIKKTIIISS